MEALKSQQMEVPTLVFYSAFDDHVAKEETEAVAATLADKTVIVDPNGKSHRVPIIMSSEMSKVTSFVKKNLGSGSAASGAPATAAATTPYHLSIHLWFSLEFHDRK